MKTLSVKIVGFFIVALFVLAQGAMQVAMASDINNSGLSEIEKRAYMLPDGTLPIFCDPEGDKTGPSMCEGSLSKAHFSLGRIDHACLMRFVELFTLSPIIDYHVADFTQKRPARGPPLA